VVISVASAAAGFVYGASRGERQRPDERHAEDSDEDSVADGDLSAVSAGYMKPCKLVRCFGISGLVPLNQLILLIKVLVVRTDLNMTTGKIAAQCG
jgi:hypothetical protein